MSFFRSDRGIENQSLFVGRRFVVYVEEGADVDPGRSVDKAFWFEFFLKVFKGEEVFEIRGLGGKSNVLEMARRIVERNIHNSLCAMDRDYDELFGELIHDSRVFYTFGYGAENDLFERGAIGSLVAAALPVGSERKVHAEALWGQIVNTLKLERRSLLGDQIAACRGAAVLDRAKPVGVLEGGATSGLPVRFRRMGVRNLMRGLRGRQKVKVPIVDLAPSARLTPAHLYFEIVYHSFIRYLHGKTVVKYSKDAVKQIVLSSLYTSFFSVLSGAAKRYYRNLARRKLSRFSSVEAR